MIGPFLCLPGLLRSRSARRLERQPNGFDEGRRKQATESDPSWSRSFAYARFPYDDRKAL